MTIPLIISVFITIIAQLLPVIADFDIINLRKAHNVDYYLQNNHDYHDKLNNCTSLVSSLNSTLIVSTGVQCYPIA